MTSSPPQTGKTTDPSHPSNKRHEREIYERKGDKGNENKKGKTEQDKITRGEMKMNDKNKTKQAKTNDIN
jgi:hypothetical protein